MKEITEWLDEYSLSHQNSTNEVIHWICVPLIYFSIIGALSALPVPAFLQDISIYLNFGVLGLAVSALYYVLLSRSLSIGMILFLAIIAYTVNWMTNAGLPVWQLSLAVFVLAWIGQFIGHMIEGKKPSFFKDIQFLMIGPIWLMSFIYKKLGIAY